jgi:hypothetical protein
MLYQLSYSRVVSFYEQMHRIGSERDFARRAAVGLLARRYFRNMSNALLASAARQEWSFCGGASTIILRADLASGRAPKCVAANALGDRERARCRRRSRECRNPGSAPPLPKGRSYSRREDICRCPEEGLRGRVCGQAPGGLYSRNWSRVSYYRLRPEMPGNGQTRLGTRFGVCGGDVSLSLSLSLFQLFVSLSLSLSPSLSLAFSLSLSLSLSISLFLSIAPPLPRAEQTGCRAAGKGRR